VARNSTFIKKGRHTIGGAFASPTWNSSAWSGLPRKHFASWAGFLPGWAKKYTMQRDASPKLQVCRLFFGGFYVLPLDAFGGGE